MGAFGLYPFAADPYADSEPCFRVPICREFAKAQKVPLSPLVLEVLAHPLPPVLPLHLFQVVNSILQIEALPFADYCVAQTTEFFLNWT